MYWCRSRLTAVFTSGIMLVLCASACKPNVKEMNFFDLKGYFTAQAAKLHKLNPSVLKTVTEKGISESKKLKIGDWERELGLFIGSDINVPAFKNSYKIIDEDNLLIYKTNDPKLKVREILIKKEKNKVKWILIYYKTPPTRWMGVKVPSLDQTAEKLSYFPDSLYLIEKVQTVRFIGTNIYKIQGLIGK